MMRYLNSLAGRMTLGVLAIHLVAIPLLFGGLLYIVKHAYQDQFVDNVRAETSLLASLVTEDLGTPRLESLIEESMLTGRFTFIEITDLAGRVLAAAGQRPGRSELREDFFYNESGDNRYYILLPLQDRRGVAKGSIRLVYDQTPTEEKIWLAYQRGIAVILAYIVMTLALGAYFTRKITRPLESLRSASRRIAHGHFHEPLHTTTRIGELKSLTEDLNHMRDKLVEQAEVLEHQALHDDLTQLPNRALLEDRLNQVLLSARRDDQRFSMLLMDLDHFKEVNDTLGHAAGDLILREFAARLRAAVREPDTVARLGGDEFAIILANADVAGAIDTVRRIGTALEPPFALDGRPLRVAASIGIAVYPEHGPDFDSLLRRADIAMYTAKRKRVGYALYDPAMDKDNLQQLRLGGELHSAIEQGQLTLHYQPKIELRSGRLHSIEALVRWQHPQHGMIPPDAFIPLAERAGLMPALMRSVLNQAAHQWQCWQRRGLDISIAINVSASNLQDRHFLDDIHNALATHQMPGSRLGLELTESAIMADIHHANAILQQLHVQGIHIAVDDFGTGYSSLSYLKTLPLSEVKIDKSFVLELLTNTNDRAIVRAILAMSHELGVAVVAEGIENNESLEMLKHLGCDLAQGYFIGRPQPAAQFELWYDQHFATAITPALSGSVGSISRR
jgi:diguanylate cyclase (GGDEF)-like protein